MEVHSKTPTLQSYRLPRINHSIDNISYSKKKKIVLKKTRTEDRKDLKLSWINNILSWRAILEDQKEYRMMITKIEIFNQKLIRKSKPRPK